MKKLLTFISVLVAGVFLWPSAANATLTNGKPYCVADVTDPGGTSTLNDLKPSEVCYATYAEYKDRLDLIASNKGWVLATGYVNPDHSGFRVAFFSPSSKGGCGANVFVIDHMPDGWDDQISSVTVWEHGGASCTFGHWWTGPRQGGSYVWDGVLGGGGLAYSICKSSWDTDAYYMLQDLSSFTLTKASDTNYDCQ